MGTHWGRLAARRYSGRTLVGPALSFDMARFSTAKCVQKAP